MAPVTNRSLLDQAPLWLDWQIEQVLEGRDLSKADQFQRSVSALVELLGKLPQSAIRTHYIQQVSERLSGGQDAWLSAGGGSAPAGAGPALAWPLSPT